MSLLKSLTIEHYKGFFEKQSVQFAIPDNVHNGSGLTLIVGPNNTGKTTIIESLLFSPEKKFKEGERHHGNQPRIVIENADNISTEYTNIGDGSIVQPVAQQHGINFELVPSRRYWQPRFSGVWDWGNLITQSTRSELRNAGELQLGPILTKILREPALNAKYNQYMKKLMPHFTEWTVDTNDDGNDYVKYKTLNTYHQSNLLGDGVISLFRIVAHLVHDQTSVFVIDEPELSLHPSAQKRFSGVLSELAKSKQIIVCTHSPYFVNWQDFIYGARIIRLNKHNDEKCTVDSLNNRKDYASFISSTMDDYQRPQLLDVAAKEILFSDKIMFTEGQEDVGLIRKWAHENAKTIDFDIFGYGVGGEQNMKLFLELAKDLGLQQVGALYDQGSASFASDQSSYPVYKLQQLATEDIRDKEATNGRSVKEGVFDASGSLKAQHKQHFELVMNNFIQYFTA